jgi:hypothetical protein
MQKTDFLVTLFGNWILRFRRPNLKNRLKYFSKDHKSYQQETQSFITSLKYFSKKQNNEEVLIVYN